MCNMAALTVYCSGFQLSFSRNFDNKLGEYNKQMTESEEK